MSCICIHLTRTYIFIGYCIYISMASGLERFHLDYVQHHSHQFKHVYNMGPCSGVSRGGARLLEHPPHPTRTSKAQMNPACRVSVTLD